MRVVIKSAPPSSQQPNASTSVSSSGFALPGTAPSALLTALQLGGFVNDAGEGPLAFCSGGDQSVRGKGGYVGEDSVPRLNVLDLQIQIRRLPKPVIAMVAGYAVGGGHILHMVCDLTVSDKQHLALQLMMPRLQESDGKQAYFVPCARCQQVSQLLAPNSSMIMSGRAACACHLCLKRSDQLDQLSCIERERVHLPHAATNMQPAGHCVGCGLCDCR